MTDLVIDPHQDAEEMINELIIESQTLEDLSLAELRKIGRDLGNLKGKGKTKLIYAIREWRMNRAIEKGKLEEAKEIHYKYGIEFNIHSIHNAIMARDVTGVKWLIEKGVKPGSNSIGTAIINGGLISIVRELLKAGAKVSEEDVLLAVRKGYVELLKFLIDKRIKCPQEAIYQAVERRLGKRQLEMVKYLYSIGVRIDEDHLQKVLKDLAAKQEKDLEFHVLSEVMEVMEFLEEQHGLTQ